MFSDASKSDHFDSVVLALGPCIHPMVCSFKLNVGFMVKKQKQNYLLGLRAEPSDALPALTARCIEMKQPYLGRTCARFCYVSS